MTLRFMLGILQLVVDKYIRHPVQRICALISHYAKAQSRNKLAQFKMRFSLKNKTNILRSVLIKFSTIQLTLPRERERDAYVYSEIGCRVGFSY